MWAIEMGHACPCIRRQGQSVAAASVSVLKLHTSHKDRISAGARRISFVRNPKLPETLLAPALRRSALSVVTISPSSEELHCRAHRIRRSSKALYYVSRRRFRVTKRRAVSHAALSLLKARFLLRIKSRNVLFYGTNWIATVVGLLLATAFSATLPGAALSGLKVSEAHLASAGIIGTALALVLSLSIVPAQKAADVFSTAILRLYARDRTTLAVFTLLSCAALLSLMFGTGWAFSLSIRYSLAGQLVLLGLSLDALRAFYARALSLLDPATALSLVMRECELYIRRTSDSIDRLVRVNQTATTERRDVAAARYALHTRSNLAAGLSGWTAQLEEFAHKGVARRDTQAVTAIVTTMADIGEKYAEARRDSMFLLPDFTAGMPIGVSDIGNVLNPIYESIKRICEDAVKQSNEAVVQACLVKLGQMAAHAMTMVHTSELQRTAPLAYSPVYYMEQCVKVAAPVGMEDAQLSAIRGMRQIFSRISADTDTQVVEEGALNILNTVAVAGYARQSLVVCFAAVDMMLWAAQHDIRIRGYRGVSSMLSTVLQNIAAFVPLEVVMDKTGQRMTKTFPPYSLSHEASLPALLAEVANKVQQVERKRSSVDPYYDFKKASDAIVDHYRDVARNVTFDGALLEKWTVESLLRAARVHIHLLDNPPSGAARFLSGVDKCLCRLTQTAALFFRETTSFPYHHASEACGELACIGMGLLQRQRFEPAMACGDAIRSIARKAAGAADTDSYHSAYGFADCVVKLEILARAAEALSQPQLAVTFRGHGSPPDRIPERNCQEFVEAVGTRTQQMEEELDKGGREMRLQDSPVDVLREILQLQQSAHPAT
jgi:hypothetical protein